MSKDLEMLVEQDINGNLSKEGALFLEAHLDDWVDALSSKIHSADIRLATMKAQVPGRVSNAHYQAYLTERAQIVGIKGQLVERLREVKKKAGVRRIERLEVEAAAKARQEKVSAPRSLSDELIVELRKFTVGQSSLESELRRLSNLAGQAVSELRVIRQQLEFNSSAKSE